MRVFHGADDDPLSGLANLFDAGIVFAVALLVGVVVSAAAKSGESPAQAAEALLKDRAVPLDRYRVGERELEGQGERLGFAYRLASGEVVYVPEER